MYYARRALEAAPDDSGVMVNCTYTLAYAGEDIGAMLGLVDRALALNPSFARGWYMSGVMKLWAGEPEAAIERCERAMRLRPRGQIGTVLTTVANALVFARRFGEAIPKALLAIQQDPSFPPNHRILAVAYAHLGRLGNARAALARLPETAPLDLAEQERSFRAMFRSPEHREIALSGLRLAMGIK
jgi:adenylate cyclase